MSVFRYAARDGIHSGFIMSLMAICFFGSIKIDLLIVLAFPLALYLIVSVWKFMKRLASTSVENSRFFALWLGGMYSFIFGALIAACVSAVYTVVINPEFMYDYMNHNLDMIQQSELQSEFADQAETIRRAMDAGAVVTGMDFTVTMLWTSSFLGSMVSLLLAALLSRRKSSAFPGQ